MKLRTLSGFALCFGMFTACEDKVKETSTGTRSTSTGPSVSGGTDTNGIVVGKDSPNVPHTEKNQNNPNIPSNVQQ